MRRETLKSLFLSCFWVFNDYCAHNGLSSDIVLRLLIRPHNGLLLDVVLRLAYKGLTMACYWMYQWLVMACY